jgi:hypothetical protein
MWAVTDDAGDAWEFTPIFRFVKNRGKLILEQKLVKIARVKVVGAPEKARDIKWQPVPYFDIPEEGVAN